MEYNEKINFLSELKSLFKKYNILLAFRSFIDSDYENNIGYGIIFDDNDKSVVATLYSQEDDLGNVQDINHKSIETAIEDTRIANRQSFMIDALIDEDVKIEN